jgi:hypothetical protein
VWKEQPKESAEPAAVKPVVTEPAESKLVKIGHVTKIMNMPDRTVADIEGLTEYAKLLLASLFLYDYMLRGREGCTKDNMEAAFHALLNSKHMSTEDHRASNYLSELETYALIKAVNKVN